MGSPRRAVATPAAGSRHIEGGRMTAKWLLIGFIVAGCAGCHSGSMAEKGPPGDPGPMGPAGPAGPAGSAGKIFLMNTLPVEPGDECPAGGMRIEVGLDVDQNGVLNSTEV